MRLALNLRRGGVRYGLVSSTCVGLLFGILGVNESSTEKVKVFLL